MGILSDDAFSEEKTIQVKWPVPNNNEKQTENLAVLQHLKNHTVDHETPPPLIMANNRAYLVDNFDLIKQRYSALADFELSRGKIRCCFSSITIVNVVVADGKQLRVTFKPHYISVVFEANINSRQSESWKSESIFSVRSEVFHPYLFVVIETTPSLPSISQLNTIIRQSNHLTAEHLCLIRACLLKHHQVHE